MIPCRAELICRIPLETSIRPLKRPRMSRQGHVYQPKDNQEEVEYQLMMWKKKNPEVFIDYPVICDLYIWYKTPKKRTSIFPINNRIGDLDNLLKGVLDCCQRCAIYGPHDLDGTKGILDDDRLVIGSTTYKLYGDRDHAVLRFYKPSEQEIKTVLRFYKPSEQEIKSEPRISKIPSVLDQ